ncbi:MAG: HlyD family efflux transporter periplasmic adaptor subunit [Ignavibacteriae bacterium]|nr:HlyD family efflux transporter periplasmic adaptor subunit [Ignavibacteriota bacterium]
MPKLIDKGNKLNLRSEEVQEILTSPPSWIIRWGITLIFAFTLIIIILSVIIKYPDFVSAKVIVTTKQPTEKVIARSSGQLDKLFVYNRDTVKNNTVLAVIKNTANYKDVYKLKDLIDTISFNTETIIFPFDLTRKLQLGEMTYSFIAFEKSYTNYKLFKELKPYSNELAGNKVSLSEIKERLKKQVLQKELLEKEYELKKTDYKRNQELFEKGVISKLDMERKELEFIQMQKDINSMAISISQMREAISTANQTLKKTIINEQEDSTRSLNELIQSFTTLKDAIKDWEYKYVLKSSISGVVSFQDVWGENQFINAGNLIFSILPTDTSELVGKLVIPSQNAGKVLTDQKVFVKLDNYPYQQYGSLIGKVSNYAVSPNDDGNYVVYISLPDGTKTSYNKTLTFTQELLGNAEIVTEDLTIAERIFYKFKEIFSYN